MIEHFNPVLVFLCLGVSQAFEHLQKYTYVITFSDAVSVGVNLEPPREATLRDQRRIRVHDLIVIGRNLILVLPDP